MVAVVPVGLPTTQGAPLSRAIENFILVDHRGKQHALSDFAKHELVVVAFLGVDCPLAKLYANRLNDIASEYANRGVAMFAIDSNRQDSLSELAAFARRHELTYALLKDNRNQVADIFGAERTPQVFLLDADRRVRYQGRVDDQYVVGVARNHASREDLKIALDELLAGREVSQPETKSLGCLIGRVRPDSGSQQVTYARDVAPLLESRCVECHRAGEIAPFELTTYDDAAGWGEMMVEVIRDRRMPPWHANPAHGQFSNDRSMPEAEKQVIYDWVEAGCPQGDATELPEPRKYTTGWQLPREPDLVFEMPDPFTVPADAGNEGVPYQYFRVATNFLYDTWIEASEVKPGNTKVVHHTIVYAQPPGAKRRRDWIFLSAYVPGLRYDPLPERSAKLVPAGSELVFEMHYTPTGKRQTDVTKIGLLLANPDQIDREVITVEVGNVRFRIPPHEPDHVVTATSEPLAREVTLLSLSPHMHLRGKSFRYELVTPEGVRRTLLDVPAYDFNWQTRYELSEPLQLPAGAVIHCRAVFDNSADNLANPNPDVAVRWGDQSWDEMMLGYFDVMLPRNPGRPAAQKPVSTGLDLVGMFDKADANGDGGLGKREAADYKLLTQHFQRIDTNNDQLLQLGEILAAIAKMRG